MKAKGENDVKVKTKAGLIKGKILTATNVFPWKRFFSCTLAAGWVIKRSIYSETKDLFERNMYLMYPGGDIETDKYNSF